MADDPFAKYAAPQPATPDAEKDPFAKYVTAAEPKSSVGLGESMLRGMAEGATFGFDDNLGLDKARREASKKANPWTHFVGEVVGGAAPMALASLLPSGVGQAAAAGRAGQLATRAAGLVRGAMVPGEIGTAGQAALQGSKLGTVYGGLSGAGHADVADADSLTDSLAKRATGAAKGAVMGAAIGAPLGVVAHGAYRGAQALGGLKAVADSEAGDVGQGAIKTALRKLAADRIKPDDIIKQIRAEFPDDSATAGLSRRFWGDISNRHEITADHVEEIVRRALAGETAAEISKAIQAASGGTGPGETVVRNMMTELANRYLGPLNLVDRAAMVRPGSGDNTQMTMRAAAATPGQHLGDAREALLERQVGANQRLGQLFDRTIGSSDYEGVAARQAKALEDAGGRAYGLALAQEKPFNLRPIFDRWEAQFDAMRGVVPDSVRAEMRRMLAPDGSPPSTLQGFIYAREGLRDLIGSLPPKSNQQRHLTSFYNDISEEVARTNPAWKAANDLWRDGKAAQEAMEAGARMSSRLNASSRENLAEFTTAQKDASTAATALRKAKAAAGNAPTPAQQSIIEAQKAKIDAANARMQLFRVGLVRALNDTLANQGETHNLTRQLLLPGAQKMLRTVLGPDADQFFKVVRAEQTIHRTYSSQFGSQTTPLREAVDELNWAPRFEANWHNLGLGKVLQLATEYAARNINANRNVKLMDLYTSTDRLRQLEALRAMQTLQAARSDAGNAIGRPAIAFGSGLLPEAVPAFSGRPEPYRP